MFCRNCGTQLSDEARFCMNCGTPTIPIPQQTVAPVEEVAAPVEEVVTPVEENVAPTEEVTVPVEETVAPANEVVEEAEFIFCRNCGNQLKVDALFCGKCGTATIAKSQQPEAPAKDAETPAEETVSPVEETAPIVEEVAPVVEEAEFIFCRNCGNQLKVDALFCGKCGTPTITKQQSETPAEDIETPVEETAAPVEEIVAPVEEVVPVEEEATPVAEEIVPFDEEVIPVEEIVPVVEDAVPVEEVKFIFCRNCGNQLKVDALFCGQCGTPTMAKQQSETPAEDIEPPVEETVAPVEENVAPVEEEIASAQEVIAPAEETTSTEESAPVEEETVPAEETALLAEYQSKTTLASLNLKKSLGSVSAIIATVLYMVLFALNIIGNVNYFGDSRVLDVLGAFGADASDFETAINAGVILVLFVGLVPTMLILVGLICNLIESYRKNGFSGAGFVTIKIASIIKLVLNSIMFAVSAAGIVFLLVWFDTVVDSAAKGLRVSNPSINSAPFIETLKWVMLAVCILIAVWKAIQIVHNSVVLSAAGKMKKAITDGCAENRRFGALRTMNYLLVTINSIILSIQIVLLILRTNVVDFIADTIKKTSAFTAADISILSNEMDQIAKMFAFGTIATILLITALLLFNINLSNHAHNKEEIKAQ